MRIFEIILCIATIIIPFYISLKNHLSTKEITLGTLGLLFLLHLIFEGLRWQMSLVYFIVIILSYCIYKKFRFFKGGWFRKILSGLGLLILIVPAWLLPNLLPVFKLPRPTGEYRVGTQYIHLKTTRDESITTKTDDKRELMIKAWYPATLNGEHTEKYLNEGDRFSFAVKYGLPKTIFNYLDYVKTHTYSNAKVAKGKFPILIFSHGSYSKASGYYALLEEIVSHGFIVLNINHTYESTGTLFPNGEIKYFNKEYDQKYNNQKMREMAWNSTQEYFKAKSWEEKHNAIENCLREYIAAEITERWSKDMRSVIDELVNWNSSTFLSNHIDVNKVGAFGHSQGGSAAGQALLDDKRIKAAISIDGVQWGVMIDTMMTKPFALLSSDWSDSHPNFNKHAYHNGSTSLFLNAKISNSAHSNFMDIPLMVNHSSVNQAGGIDPNLATKLTAKFVLKFFDTFLLNKENDILNLSNEHSELEIKLHEKSNIILK